MKLLTVFVRCAQACALLAGLLLTAITLMTCASVLGRSTLGVTLVGDFELTGLATGVATALFMPLCQLRRGHITVDFFTARLSSAATERLDRLGALLLAGVFALLAWRTAVGTLNSLATHSETQILGFPEWLAYAAMVPPLALTGLLAGVQSIRGFASFRTAGA